MDGLFVGVHVNIAPYNENFSVHTLQDTPRQGILAEGDWTGLLNLRIFSPESLL